MRGGKHMMAAGWELTVRGRWWSCYEGSLIEQTRAGHTALTTPLETSRAQSLRQLSVVTGAAYFLII